MLRKRLVYDESSRTWVNINNYSKYIFGIVYIDEKYTELGYFSSLEKHKLVKSPNFDEINVLERNCKVKVYFNRSTGCYTFTEPEQQVMFGYGGFPYNFNRYYSTRFLEETFQKRHNVEQLVNYNYINELPYTFGLEFETSAGYIPEDELFRVGLIPLRDGSITGLEYSTIVMEGNLGLNTLREQIDILKEYTIFDKECSLHIHFGNFKLNPNVLIRLNNLFATSDIESYLVPYAFYTSKYKANGKDYCKKNAKFYTFEEMYRYLVGQCYFGNLYQPHPCDLNGVQKWHISTRYVALNLINAVCYNNGKTAEFRMLRPTYNFNKILVWIFILGAYIKYAENVSLNAINNISLPRIINTVYSSELANVLIRALTLQKEVTQTQRLVSDKYGMRVDIEDQILTYNNLSKNLTFFY